MTLRRLAWYLVIGASVAASLAFAFRPQPVPVDIATVERGELVVTIDGDGKTRVREVYVVSAPVSGRLLRIGRHAGDVVAANETVLATVQPTDPTFLDRRARAQAEAAIKAAEAALKLAEAELDRSRAELSFASADLERAEKLAARQTISRRELDLAVLEERTRRAAVETAEATVSMRRFDLETARAALIQPGEADANSDTGMCCVDVTSPVDGTVLRVIHESEAVVAAGTPLLEIGNPVDLEVVVDLLSTDAVKVETGAVVMIEDWGGAGTLAGRVQRIEPYGFTKVSALGIEEQRVNVIIDLADPRDRWSSLGHGFRVEARIVAWKRTDVPKVPLGALFRDGDAWAVFAVEDDRAKLRRVQIDHSNGREAEILDGLAPGEHVILHPGDQIAEGVRVEQR